MIAKIIFNTIFTIGILVGVAIVIAGWLVGGVTIEHRIAFTIGGMSLALASLTALLILNEPLKIK